MKTQVISAVELLDRVQDLPSLPDVVLKVYKMAGDPQVNARGLALLISRDQALAARVLRMANSAYYGLTRQVSTIDEAVVVLGVQAIKHLALLAATYPWLQKSLCGYSRQPNALWYHSLATALIAQTMSRMIDLPNKNEAFTAGLLHDLGKLVINTYFQDWMVDLYEMLTDGHLLVYEAETKLLGLTHMEVGAILAERWNLPESLPQAIYYHHHPAACEEPLCAVTHLSDHCATVLGYALNPELPHHGFVPEALDILHLSEHQWQGIMHKVGTCLEESQEIFNFK